MKNKRGAGSLFGLLARNYLLFTLTLLLIAGGIYLLWNSQLDRAFESADWDALLVDDALQRGDYGALSRHIRGGSAFAVYDGAGERLYASEADGDLDLTPGELGCLPEYGGNEYVESAQYTAEDGEIHYILSKTAYDADGTAHKVGEMVLNSRFQVVSGGFGDGRSAYTVREFALLTGGGRQDYTLYRCAFTDGQGRELTLLMKNVYLSTEDYYQTYKSAWRLWLLFIPLYALAVGAFIWWLDRTIRQPLGRLNRAVIAQAEGRPAEVGGCGGPSEIRRIGESFDRLSDQLAESERERARMDEGRQKLIADISHDLKTPVTVIAGYADAICDGKVPPEELERYLRAIQGKAETLTELINAFHEYSKTEHPDFSVSLRRTDLCEYLREYLAKKYDEIDLAGFTLEVSIPEKPIFCAIDELQFQRALDNLLSNSIRHNRLGTLLFFHVSAAAVAVLRVGDNGSGIPPDRAATIFEPFVVGSDARGGGGSGLGLAITRRIVEKHGGTVELSPAPPPDWSTEFIIRLPLDGSK